MEKILLISVLGLTLMFADCTRKGASIPTSEEEFEVKANFDRSELRQLLRADNPYLIVYGSNTDSKAAYEKITFELKRGSRFRQIEVLEDIDCSQEEFNSSVVQLIGTPNSNVWIEQISKNLPFHIHENHIEFNGKKYEDSTTVVALNWYPNPQNPSIPVRVITSFSDQAIEAYFKNQFTGEQRVNFHRRMDLEILNSTDRLAMSNFKNNWQLDNSSIIEFGDNLGQSGSTRLINYSGSSAAEIDDRLSKWLECVEYAEQMIGKPFTKSIDVILYPSAEDKALRTNNMMQSHIDSDVAHTVQNEIYNKYIPDEWLTLLLQRNASGLTSFQQEYLGAFINRHSYLSKHYERFPLSTKEFNWTWDELFSEIDDSYSQKLISVLRNRILLELYNNDVDISKELNFKTLEAQFAHHMKSSKPQKDLFTKKRMNGERGFNFAHEGYNIYNGYGSRLAQKSLERTANIGSTATAVIPYTFLRDPKRVDHIPLIQSAGNENDESVIQALYFARDLDMITMLKPQIWIPRSWPGDIDFASEEDWDRFIYEYKRWIIHYAIIAEIHRIDILCVGTEFQKFTLQKPDVWRDIIASVRSVYSGNITYAANWGEEFENIEFWDALDFVGCDAYYPLSAKSDPTDKELRTGINEMMQKLNVVAEKYNKDILLTEIGYCSLDAPWRSPHDDNLPGDFNEDDQARIIELVSEAIEANEKIVGTFWWKWPSYIGYADEKPKGFTVANRKAENIIFSD